MTHSKLIRGILLGLRHRRSKDAAVSIATLVVGSVALLGADYGIPIWLQVFLYLWLLTVGLPTTLTVLSLAAVWGRFEPFYGMNGFMAVSFLAAPVVQVLVMERLRRRRPGSDSDAPTRKEPVASQGPLSPSVDTVTPSGDL
jgi:hypothetical protein